MTGEPTAREPQPASTWVVIDETHTFTVDELRDHHAAIREAFEGEAPRCPVVTGEPTAPVLDRVRELAEKQNALDKRNAIDDRITDAFQREVHAGVVLSLVEYVQANEAYTAACNLVFERRADPVSLAAPLARLERARETLGLPHIPMAGRDDDV